MVKKIKSMDELVNVTKALAKGERLRIFDITFLAGILNYIIEEILSLDEEKVILNKNDIMKNIKNDDELKVLLKELMDYSKNKKLEKYIQKISDNLNKQLDKQSLEYIMIVVASFVKNGLKYKVGKIPILLNPQIKNKKIIAFLHFLNQSEPDISRYEIEIENIKNKNFTKEKEQSRIDMLNKQLEKNKEYYLSKPVNELVKNAINKGLNYLKSHELIAN